MTSNRANRFSRTVISLGLALLLFVLPACNNTPAESSDPDSSTPGSDTSATTSTTEASGTTSGTESTAPSGSTGTQGTTSGSTGSTVKPTTSKTTKKTTTATTQKEEDVMCTDYDYRNDKFYKKDKYYISWINTWYGSTESWFNVQDRHSKYTAKLKVNGEYVTPDNNLQPVREEIFKQAKEAKIDALFMDLTNGYSGWTKASKAYQKMCYENGMKFGVATHPRIENGVSNIETICEYTWKSYAGPGEAIHSSAYFYKEGKPLMVLYCTWQEFQAALRATGKYTSRFAFTWASGEDSKTDKWGWQLEAQDGPQLSSDSMFVTCSISWNSPNGSKDSWRKSLAFFDFCFLAAKEANPKYTIVGMIDDTHERNGWMKMDTTNVVYTVPKLGDKTVPEICRSLQMRDIYGNISEDAFYNRVKSWINGTVKPYHTGGLIADGAYTLTNVASNKKFGTDRPASGANRIPSTDVGGTFQPGNVLTPMESYYWFYHLGNNEYRVIKLSSGLALQNGDNDKLVQLYMDTSAEQRWILKKNADGTFQILNKKTGKAITDAGKSADIVLTAANSGDQNQLWKIEPVAGRTFG